MLQVQILYEVQSASIAQLAVRGTYNAEVMGSSPIIRIVVGSDISLYGRH
jgi:hypothetical protein